MTPSHTSLLSAVTGPGVHAAAPPMGTAGPWAAASFSSNHDLGVMGKAIPSAHVSNSHQAAGPWNSGLGSLKSESTSS